MQEGAWSSSIKTLCNPKCQGKPFRNCGLILIQSTPEQLNVWDTQHKIRSLYESASYPPAATKAIRCSTRSEAAEPQLRLRKTSSASESEWALRILRSP